MEGEEILCGRCGRTPRDVGDLVGEWVFDGSEWICPGCVTGIQQRQINAWKVEEEAKDEQLRDAEARRTEMLTDEELRAEYGDRGADAGS